MAAVSDSARPLLSLATPLTDASIGSNNKGHHHKQSDLYNCLGIIITMGYFESACSIECLTRLSRHCWPPLSCVSVVFYMQSEPRLKIMVSLLTLESRPVQLSF